MEPRDLAVRRATYGLFVELGCAPAPSDVAERLSLTTEEVGGAWQTLHDQHALVLNSAGQIRMANPFSAVPTAHAVRAQGRSWFANCAWDAFGILAALGADGQISTSCPDCGSSIAIRVAKRQPDRDDLLFHCLVPANRWWDDIVFT